MTIVNVRELLAFPGGDNSSDTVIGNVHFNKTTLDFFNYTLYSNGTISNGSRCYLTFEPYAPALVLTNGSFINATWCYEPIKPIATRASIGLGFAVAFGLTLVAVLINLTKHGRTYLPAEKRFYPIGRRWQWYWGIFTCAAAIISLFTNIDVDRFYLPQLPIVLNSFFWFLMQEGAMAVVWEAVRHWGSWMERQYIDPNPFMLREDDRRAKFEFYLPLWFYLWLWLNFFMIIPRNWEEIMLQRSPEQTAAHAVRTATDSRFKVGGFFLVICWLTIVASLYHSIHHYKPRHRGLFNRAVGLVSYIPLRFLLIVPLALCVAAFQVLVSFSFNYSVLNVKGNNLAIFLGGYGPALLILIIQCLYGWASPNEDKELIRQRRVRGDAIDHEMGLVRKPAWWKRAMRDDHNITSMSGRIARNVRELGGGNVTAQGVQRNLDVQAQEEITRQNAADIEMGVMGRSNSTASKLSSRLGGPNTAAHIEPYVGKSDRRRTERTMSTAAGLLFPNSGPSAVDRRAELMLDGPPPAYTDTDRGRQPTVTEDSQHRPSTNERSNSTSTGVSISSPPQQVRSMLDV